MGTTLRSRFEERGRKGGNTQDSAPFGASRRAAVTLTWPAFWVQSALFILPWVVIVLLWRGGAITAPVDSALGISASSGVGTPGAVFNDRVQFVQLGNAGPWGQLEVTSIGVAMPTEFVYLDPNAKPQRWFFTKMTFEKLHRLFRTAPLTDDERAKLDNEMIWEATENGIWMMPPEDVVWSMSPEARAMIYTELARAEENEAQRTAFVFKPEFIERRIEISGWTPETKEMFRRLLYPYSKSLLLADTLYILPKLKNDAERISFIKTVSRKATLMARLQVTPQTDIDELVSYWGAGGRSKDLRSLLESLARIEGGYAIDIVHLLPSFARRRIYTFPNTSTNPLANTEDCHWSAMNFFNNAEPDDKYKDLNVVSKEIDQNFTRVSTPGQLGDLVFLVDKTGGAVHSAVYVADDIVFTKNGVRFTEPWILMTLPDLVELYTTTRGNDDPLQVVYFRDKSST